MYNIIEHKSKAVMESQLATLIAKQLEIAIKKNSSAQLLVSGGTTPKGMYNLLSLKPIDWSRVCIGLVDERYVPNSSEHSNEKLIKENLLINLAKDASLVPMFYVPDNEEKNIEHVNEKYKRFHNSIDVCLLGMGADGHTASLFPGDKNSEAYLLSDEQKIIATRSPQHPQQRISCSKQLLLNSDNIYLMITGSEKMRVLKSASVHNYPIAHFTTAQEKPIEIHYSEN